RDEIDAERAVGALARRRDLGIEIGRLHRAAGDDTEAAAIRDGRDEIALADPGHGTAHDREFAAEEVGAAAPEMVEQATRGVIRPSRIRRGRFSDGSRLD